MAKPKSDPQTTKRRVTMRSVVALPDGTTAQHEAVDYVPEDILDAYVADARTRWQAVIVSDNYDAGPGGHDGDTAELEHLTAGKTLQQHLHDTGVKALNHPSNPRVGA